MSRKIDQRWQNKNNRHTKKTSLYVRKEYPTPFNVEDRFLIEASDTFFILTILSIHKVDGYKTYQYNMNVEEFEEEVETEDYGMSRVVNNINYIWRMNTSPPIVERVMRGFITHSVLLGYKNNIIPLEEYAKIVLTKKEVVSDRLG